MRKKLYVLFIFFACVIGGFSSSFAQKPSAQLGKKMPVDNKFDFLEYGRVEKYELNLKLKITQKGSDVLVSLFFENISKRDLNVYPMMWFTDLFITVNGQKVDYIGPMASIPAPKKTDYKTIKPGENWTTESVLISSYYRIPKIPGAQAIVKYDFHKNVKVAEESFEIK